MLNSVGVFYGIKKKRMRLITQTYFNLKLYPKKRRRYHGEYDDDDDRSVDSSTDDEEDSYRSSTTLFPSTAIYG